MSEQLTSKAEEQQREKICISITEGCIRHYNEDPEIEEQFILRLPERESKIVREALEMDTLENRLTITLQKNQRDAQLTLDGKQLIGRMLDLPTIIESHKLADESTIYKTADIAQILICNNVDEKLERKASTSANSKKRNSFRTQNDYKFANGLCPPLKSVRKKRFRKIQLEENFDPDVDRAVKLLLKADGAAEDVRFEIAYEDPADAADSSKSTEDMLSDSDDDSDDDTDSSSPSLSNEVEVFGEAISLSSDDAKLRERKHSLGLKYFFNSDLRLSDDDSSEHDIDDTDSDIGNIENYDLDTLTDEQKQHFAQLKEIEFCLSNIACKMSPPRPAARGRGRGRGRGRPRVRPSTPPEGSKSTGYVSMAGRGGRGRPPGRRGRGGRSRGCVRGRGVMIPTENEL